MAALAELAMHRLMLLDPSFVRNLCESVVNSAAVTANSGAEARVVGQQPGRANNAHESRGGLHTIAGTPSPQHAKQERFLRWCLQNLWWCGSYPTEFIVRGEGVGAAAAADGLDVNGATTAVEILGREAIEGWEAIVTDPRVASVCLEMFRPAGGGTRPISAATAARHLRGSETMAVGTVATSLPSVLPCGEALLLTVLSRDKSIRCAARRVLSHDATELFPLTSTWRKILTRNASCA